jgi:MOSC domain-containing protein YiiM
MADLNQARAQRRRLAAVVAGLGGRPHTDDAAGLLSRFASILGLGTGSDESEDATAGAESDQLLLPTVVGTVGACFLRPSNEEREVEGWTPGAGVGDPSSGHFVRRQTDALALSAVADHSAEPSDAPTRAGAADDYSSHKTFPQPGWLEDPPERGLLCQTAEGYEKLHAGLPAGCIALLSPERPGSGENLFVEGLTQWELCIGDVFASGDVRLQVSSPRRPCEYWNIVHGQKDGNGPDVRHHALTHTLAGFFFRVLTSGELHVEDQLTLIARPHPEWTLKRLGDLVYANAGVQRQDWVAWSGTAEEREQLIALPELA